jgi:hypothetical protein
MIWRGDEWALVSRFFADVPMAALVISRPPQTLEAAQRIAAGHFAFAGEARAGPARGRRDRVPWFTTRSGTSGGAKLAV